MQNRHFDTTVTSFSRKFLTLIVSYASNQGRQHQGDSHYKNKKNNKKKKNLLTWNGRQRPIVFAYFAYIELMIDKIQSFNFLLVQLS